jgi:hypothetical protein
MLRKQFQLLIFALMLPLMASAQDQDNFWNLLMKDVSVRFRYSLEHGAMVMVPRFGDQLVLFVLLPKQKDIKSFFLLSFGAPKETKALAEIIASALLEKCRKTGQGWFYCCKTRYATFGRHTLAVLQAFFNSTLANTEFPHGLPAALNIMVEYLQAFQILSLLTRHHEFALMVFVLLPKQKDIKNALQYQVVALFTHPVKP